MNKIYKNNSNDQMKKAVIMAAFLLCFAIIYLLAGILFGFYLPCPFRTVTGLKCPGCGMSHASTHLALAASSLISSDTAQAHDQIIEAFRSNALFIPIFAYLIYAFVQFCIYKDLGKTKISRVIDTAFLIIILIWWILRNTINM